MRTLAIGNFIQSKSSRGPRQLLMFCLVTTLCCAAKAQEPAATTTTAAPEKTASAVKSGKPTKTQGSSKDAPKDNQKDNQKDAPKDAKKSVKKSSPPTAADSSGGLLPKDVKKLIVEDTIVGQGKIASKGKKIKVNFTGWLYDPNQPMGRGKQFTTSAGRDPFEFQLGSGIVIRGWDEGFENMKVGGKRKLIVPAEMAYGDRGAGTEVPAKAPLMFEVELIEVF